MFFFCCLGGGPGPAQTAKKKHAPAQTAKKKTRPRPFRACFFFAVWAGGCVYLFAVWAGGVFFSAAIGLLSVRLSCQGTSAAALMARQECAVFAAVQKFHAHFAISGPQKGGRSRNGLGGGVFFFLLFGRGRVFFLLFGPGACFFFLLFGRGTGVHSLTRLPGSSLSDPTTKETEQQKKKTRVPLIET